jgi:translation initiation factor IF-1
MMRTLAILTTLALALSVAAPVAAQDKQDKDKDKNKGALGGVLDTLGNVLGTGPQKLQGTVVLSEGSTFVLRTDDKRTYRVDTASLDPQKAGTLTPGQTVSVTARGGGQAGVLTASEITPDAKSSGKTFQTVSGTVQEAGRQRVLFKTRDGLVVPVDVSNINGLPYLTANQPATLYYEQGSRQEIVAVWVQPGSGQPSASQPTTSQPTTSQQSASQPSPSPSSAPPASTPSSTAPSASVSSSQSIEGQVESIGVAELKLQTSDGRAVTVDTSGVDRQAMRAISPGDVVTVTGQGATTSDRFVAQSVQPRR